MSWKKKLLDSISWSIACSTLASFAIKKILKLRITCLSVWQISVIFEEWPHKQIMRKDYSYSQIETFFAPVTRGLLSHLRPSTQGFDFYERLNNRLNKQWGYLWFETPQHPCGVIVMIIEPSVSVDNPLQYQYLLHGCRCPGATLQWRHNEHHCVSNYRFHDYLLKRLFRRRFKKMFPFDDAIMD